MALHRLKRGGGLRLLSIDPEDATFNEGYVGLWTKGDAVTEFDDLQASGTAVQ